MELPENLIDYLKINVKDENSLDEIFNPLVNYLQKIRDERFRYELLLPLEGIIGKFTSCITYLGGDLKDIDEKIMIFMESVSHFLFNEEDISSLSKRLLFSLKNRPYRGEMVVDNGDKMHDPFMALYNSVIKTYNAAKNLDSKPNPLSLSGFYNPDNSNKVKAKHLISEAIEVINKDTSLTDKTKKQIVEYLNNAIAEFEKPNSNWNIIFGQLRQIIFILGALGSLAGGITGVVTVLEAKEKLEKAADIIEKTSINVNYNNVQQIFKLTDDNFIIETKETKLLPESKKE